METAFTEVLSTFVITLYEICQRSLSIPTGKKKMDVFHLQQSRVKTNVFKLETFVAKRAVLHENIWLYF